jgi:hypothetical protein
LEAVLESSPFPPERLTTAQSFITSNRRPEGLLPALYLHLLFPEDSIDLNDTTTHPYSEL